MRLFTIKSLNLFALSLIGCVPKMTSDKEKPLRSKISSRDTVLKNVFRAVRHTLWSVEHTDFHPDFVRMYEEAKEFGKVTKSLIERIKNMVQRNSYWHNDIIPPSDENTPLDLFVACLTDDSKSLKTKSSKVSIFYDKFSASIGETGKAHNQLLMFIKVNTLQPMEKYINEILEQIRTEYHKLQRYKTIYDDGRSKLKHCPPEKIEQQAEDLNEMKREFEKQANLGL